MKNIQFIQITPEELLDLILKSLEQKLEELKTQLNSNSPTEYLNREEVAELLRVDVSTIHNWRKDGKIVAYGIGGRRLYKRQEIEEALIKMQE